MSEGYVPGRRWHYQEPSSQGAGPPVVVTMTEEEIIANYYDVWKTNMIQAGHGDQIGFRACIEDWVVVHWAEPVNE